ncbi:PIN domain-containing protein [Candidatus Parcubacteria bacterium]|nr:PIN domain-containing protein [Candidatus Parcubacteria bacterium]
MPKEKTRERWYYDSNTLDNQVTYKEIIDKNHPIEVVISHLAIGEAYGNALHKSEEAAEILIDILNKIKRYIKIVQNDGPDRIFNDVRDTFDRLTVTDALHLATAIENDCCILRSCDPDLCGLDGPKLKGLINRNGLDRFTITSMKKN